MEEGKNKRKIFAFVCGYSRLKTFRHSRGCIPMFKVGAPI